MVARTREQASRLLRIDFVRFCIVGGVGFVINFILLTTFHKGFGLPIFISQLIAAEIALFSNFMMHHHWTYKSKKVKKTFPLLLVQFHATSWPAIVGSALMVAGAEKYLHFGNLLALVISSVIALGWNFVWSKFVVWRNITTTEIEEIAQ